ncbi:MAG TPA: hypothetical protein VHC19_09705 [Pirellulales bacterium]|nr:hypothetical protein [Pirellulales bacterium]
MASSQRDESPEPGSFQSPPSGERTGPSAFELHGEVAASRAIEMLTQTRPWVRFLSVLGFIATALLAAAGLLGGVVAQLGLGGSTPADIAISCLLLGLLHFFPSLFLWRYADRITNLHMTQAASDIEFALEAQRAFWRFVGIAVALMLTLNVLLIPFAILFSMMLPDQQ